MSKTKELKKKYYNFFKNCDDYFYDIIIIKNINKYSLLEIGCLIEKNTNYNLFELYYKGTTKILYFSSGLAIYNIICDGNYIVIKEGYLNNNNYIDIIETINKETSEIIDLINKGGVLNE